MAKDIVRHRAFDHPVKRDVIAIHQPLVQRGDIATRDIKGGIGKGAVDIAIQFHAPVVDFLGRHGRAGRFAAPHLSIEPARDTVAKVIADIKIDRIRRNLELPVDDTSHDLVIGVKAAPLGLHFARCSAHQIASLQGAQAVPTAFIVKEIPADCLLQGCAVAPVIVGDAGIGPAEFAFHGLIARTHRRLIFSPGPPFRPCGGQHFGLNIGIDFGGRIGVMGPKRRVQFMRAGLCHDIPRPVNVRRGQRKRPARFRPAQITGQTAGQTFPILGTISRVSLRNRPVALCRWKLVELFQNRENPLFGRAGPEHCIVDRLCCCRPVFAFHQVLRTAPFVARKL